MTTPGSSNSNRARAMNRTLGLALLTTFLTTSSFGGLSEACTLMGANGTATADGHVYLASTSDNPYIEGPRNQVYLTIPKEGFKFVHTPLHIQDPPGHYFDVGSDRGMNEKGFSWTRAWVVPNEPQAANKMNAVDWFLKMGSTVATVDEAIKFVQDNPKGIGDQGNYIFADADGNMAAVEVGYQTVNVVQKWTKGEKGVVARANLWTSDKMKPIDISNTADEHDHQYAVSTGYRVPRAMELLNGGTGKINVDTLSSSWRTTTTATKRRWATLASPSPIMERPAVRWLRKSTTRRTARSGSPMVGRTATPRAATRRLTAPTRTLGRLDSVRHRRNDGGGLLYRLERKHHADGARYLAHLNAKKML